MQLISFAGIEIPRFHKMLHLTQRVVLSNSGNPRFHATWEDESLSRRLKLTLRNCHQCHFEPMALCQNSPCAGKLLGADAEAC
eukprot:3049029-Alexandrium_andersonii.AAC.1